ncbi:MAG: kelch repeat-containing protein [Paludibacter sp.]|jgi:N-acetylneuraminic acid mutarotase|nr:kelch repeat-containing protein [Paludibacter sp.]
MKRDKSNLGWVFVAIAGISAAMLISCDENPLIEGDPLELKAVEVPVPLARSSASVFVTGGNAYLVTGRDAVDQMLNDCHRYNPADGSWTECDTLPSLRRVNGVAIGTEEYGYAGLGFNIATNTYNAESQLRDWWRFNPSDGSWERKADFPALATNGSISFVYEGRIYIGFGFDGWTFTRSMWCYDPDNDSWTGLAPPPVDIRAGAVVCTDGHRVFFGSGFKINDLNDWWEYFPGTDSWEVRTPQPGKGRHFGVGFSVGGRFFVATGRYFGGLLDDGFLHNNILEYEPDSDRWIDRGAMPGGGRQNAVAFVIGNKAYIGFGENDTTILGDLWVFEP